MKKLLIIPIFLLYINLGNSQIKSQDTLKFKDYHNPFWEEIEKSSNEFAKKPEKKQLRLLMDFTNVNYPKSTEEFTQVWHNAPVSQGWTGMCWDFSTTSFFESEVNRIYNKKIKLSEAWTAYWEFVEKARGFVRTSGQSYFGEGSESNAVPRIWKQYGVVPYDAYTGLLPGQKFLDQHQMYDEMNTFLQSVKKNNFWNEEIVISTIKQIMNKYMQAPPEKFTYEGKEYNSKTFFDQVVKLNMDDYVDIMSLLEPGYWKQCEYDVPDNWWNDSSYYNVPLDKFMDAIKNAIKNGYSVAIGGDVSEPGHYSEEYNLAAIPTWDIPSQYIDDKARQFRFSNAT
ncbi:MAG TPA: C1 family peptidase, partial [Bacteroidota bacterium]|nr:C1 family peptidase [Bacteroidota bacterium]